MPSFPSWTTSTASPDSPKPRWMLAARRRSSSISKILMTSSIRTAPKRYLKSRFRVGQSRRPNWGFRSGGTGQEPQEVSMLKTPKTIGLLALPVVLAAAVITASGGFAKGPAHQAAATAPTTAPTATPSQSAAAPSQSVAPKTELATEPAEAAEPAETETSDAAAGHADDPNDSNADHQFNGEE